MNRFLNFLLPAGSVEQEATIPVRRNRLALRIGIIGLMLICTVGAAQAQVPQTSNTTSITVPPVPTDVRVDADNEVFFVGHAVGTQNYVCQPSGTGVAFVLFTPQATLFDYQGEQVTTHFFSPNPFEKGIVRATWQHSHDTSTVWAQVTGSSTDSNFVRKGAIAWLRLDVKDTGVLAGPTGGDKLAKTTFIQRLNTFGGLAPDDGCANSGDIGKKAFIKYMADYFFYKKANRN